MDLAFEKWHGCRNDFVVVWLNPTDDTLLASLKRQSQRICSRQGDGLGADGLLILRKSSHNDLSPKELIIINADGSIAQNCGNGLRCAALSVLKRNMAEGHKLDIPEGLTFSVEGRDIDCRFITKGKLSPDARQLPYVAVDMEHPKFNEECDFYDVVKTRLFEVAGDLGLSHLTRDFWTVDLGNPHLVIFCDDVSRELLNQIGPPLQQLSGRDGVNVHIAAPSEVDGKDAAEAANRFGSPIEELFKAYSWERGVGATQACGTGACAIVASSLASGLSARSQWLGVDMPGGRLYCKQAAEDDPVILAGPGELVAHGWMII